MVCNNLDKRNVNEIYAGIINVDQVKKNPLQAPPAI